ncbi:TauD/TfdA family dioxygenase [Acinetobacter cumulans]|jgi:alpha-ketoglutarate-dependent taurine dioxygenase|uniref:TauD/TfdA family dioxygenase n=1 Tax=Acinetobacter cumulans TaxID=2136182 RepID=A0A3A8G101_9GAMM|nr:MULTISPECIES: TauD/TfdA family dioxygenase [Acinetobacter]NWK74430.1 TauD/TfdA family dioxygenase [Acinetobacter sp. SwsAc6]QCO20636.1 TauD/TfdA family dioxygenase [Acinetobacter cumulans]RKG42002.1 TauD/TfdA family dioxygenase [Acinetobacter cumulans]RKG47698.1 TauD/TfdA family dioxygenase [Acinetobacter cumulans]RKG52129.1 TauD/TfdA family dioxygenase [Acinetobacter cumulans]
MGYQFQHIQVKPINGRIGAVIEGVTLSADLEDAVVHEINQALLQHKAIFFKGQQHLDDASQEAFAARLGTPLNHPTVPVKDGSAHILEIDSRGARADAWHTDISFIEAYPKASILRSVVAPEVGGNTVWANTSTAYDDLPAELKILADSLRTVHSNSYDYAAKASIPPEVLARYKNYFNSTEYETEHPLVRVHPETGEKTLLLGSFFKNFVGYSSSESRRLYDLFQSYVEKLENIVSWRWDAGDIAIWDNRATQHRAINDYGDQHRVVRRVTLEGDTPVGVDGQPSKVLRKDVKEDISNLRYSSENGIYEKAS